MVTIACMRVVVERLNASGKPTLTWTLAHAWPPKISGPTLKFDGNEIAIEPIEVAHEGLVVADR